MVFRRVARPLIAVGLLLFAGGGAAAQRHPALTALDSIELGQWQLKSAGGVARKLCLTNRWAVLQIMHGAAQCAHFVVENTANAATIRYTCPGQGHGRTTVSVETPRLLSLDTQGVAAGAPFAEQYEARRIGACN